MNYINKISIFGNRIATFKSSIFFIYQNLTKHMTKIVTRGTLVPAQPTPTATHENNLPKAATTGKGKTKSNPRAHAPTALQASFAVAASEPIQFSVWRSTRQILEEFPISEKSLYNWRTAGILPYGLLGKKIMYNRTVIEQILMSRWKVGLVLLQLLFNFWPEY